MATKKDIEFFIEEIVLSSKLNHDATSNHAVDFTLVCPRPTVAQKSATKAITLKEGEWSKENRPWTERILFKETITGSTGMVIEISEAMTGKELDSVMRSASSSFIKLIGSLTSDLIPLKTLSSFAGIPANALAKAVSQEKETKVIAQASIDMDGETLALLNDEGPLFFETELIAKEDITDTTKKTVGKSGATRAVKKVLIREGAPLGIIKIRLQAL